MKRIFLIDEHISSKQNGVGTFMTQFLESLRNTECEVNFLSFNDSNDHLRISVKDGYRYYQIPFSNRGDFLMNGGQVFPLLSLYIKDTPENLFFINHSPCADFMKALRRNFPKSKIVFTIHDQGWTSPCLGDVEMLQHILQKKRVCGKDKRVEQFVRRYCRNERTMYRTADAVVCLNQSTYDLLQDCYFVPEEKIWLIPNGIEISSLQHSHRMQAQKEAKSNLGIQADEQLFLFVGRPTKAKGLFELLAAYDKFFLKYPDTRLVIAGGVENFSECSKYSVNSAAHVTYTGLIPKEKLDLWYKAADFGVLPSYTEQCSFAGLEMMQNIGIVIATDGWGLNNMFKQGDNALVAHIPDRKEDKTNGLVENLLKALSQAYHLQQEEREMYRKRTQKNLLEHYDAEMMRQHYVELINSL